MEDVREEHSSQERAASTKALQVKLAVFCTKHRADSVAEVKQAGKSGYSWGQEVDWGPIEPC